MPFITTAEKIGIEKGLKQGLQQRFKQGREEGIRQGLLKAIELGLELKFGAKGLHLLTEIKKIRNINILENISNAIKTANNINDIRKIYM
jgi:flagellar biosynthesis/type III secretory pathway protein FliH